MAEGNNHIEEHKSTTGEVTSARMILTLAMAGLFSGILLSLVYIFTKPIIAENKKLILAGAIQKVLPGTYSYDTMIVSHEGLVLSEGKKADRYVFLGTDSAGNITGFAIPGEEPGFQDIIKGLIGYNPYEEMIVGFEVLESKETPGLGDKIFKDKDFTSTFAALPLAKEYKVVKKGEKESTDEVEGITGATISSKAVIRLINNSIDEWEEPLKGFVDKENKQNAGY